MSSINKNHIIKDAKAALKYMGVFFLTTLFSRGQITCAIFMDYFSDFNLKNCFNSRHRCNESSHQIWGPTWTSLLVDRRREEQLFMYAQLILFNIFSSPCNFCFEHFFVTIDSGIKNLMTLQPDISTLRTLFRRSFQWKEPKRLQQKSGNILKTGGLIRTEFFSNDSDALTSYQQEVIITKIVKTACILG